MDIKTRKVKVVLFVFIIFFISINKTYSSPKKLIFDTKINFNFHNTNLKIALQTIAKSAGLEAIFIDKNIYGKLTLNDQNISLKNIIKNISSKFNLDITINKSFMVIKNKNKSLNFSNLKQKTFLIKNIEAKNIIEKIKNAKIPLLSKTGSVFSSLSSNRILIIDNQKNIALISKLIKFLDKKNKNIEIKAVIFIANKKTADSLGVRWGGRKITNSMNITGGNLGSMPKDSFVSLGNAPITNFNLSKNMSSLVFGFGGGNSFLDIELSILNSMGDIKILSKPHIKTLNNNIAYIASGTEIPYQTTNKNGDSNVSFKKALLGLQVIPTILNNENLILNIEINSNTVGSIYQNVPSVDINTIKTKVVIKNKQTIILGGIIKKIQQKTITKIPILGDIPFIGWLFKYENNSEQNWELMISLTPSIT
jgi:type IV pilus assembly protein PilQ